MFTLNNSLSRTPDSQKSEVEGMTITQTLSCFYGCIFYMEIFHYFQGSRPYCLDTANSTGHCCCCSTKKSQECNEIAPAHRGHVAACSKTSNS